MGASASRSYEGQPLRSSLPATAALTRTGVLLVFLHPDNANLSSFFELSLEHVPSGDILFSFGARPRSTSTLGAADGGTVVLNSFEKQSGAWGQEVHLPHAVVFGEPGHRTHGPAPLVISADGSGVTVYADGPSRRADCQSSAQGPLRHVHFFRFRRAGDAQLLLSGVVSIKCNKCSVRVPRGEDAVLGGWLPIPRDDRLANYLSPGACLRIALPLPNQSSALRWAVSAYNRIPSTALPCGVDWSGEQLYLARCCLPDGSVLLGKVGPSSTFRGGAHVPYYETEASCNVYEILAPGGSMPTGWTQLSPGAGLPFGSIACGRTATGHPLVPATVRHFLQGKYIVTPGHARVDTVTGHVVATVAFCGDVVEFTASSADVSVLCGVPSASGDLLTAAPPFAPEPSTWMEVCVGTPLPRFVGYEPSQYGQYEAYRYEDVEPRRALS